jgi:phage protein U
MIDYSMSWVHAAAAGFNAVKSAAGNAFASVVDFAGKAFGSVASIAGQVVGYVIGRLADMAAAGDAYPLIDGLGRILGHYRIVRLDEDHAVIMAGGIPRNIAFRLELERTDDPSDALGSTA